MTPRPAELDRDAALAIVDKVRQLHHREVAHDNSGDSFDICVECSWESRGVFVNYPCPTVRLCQPPTPPTAGAPT